MNYDVVRHILDKLTWKDIKILLTISYSTIDELERKTGYNYHQVRVSLNKLRGLHLVGTTVYPKSKKLCYIRTVQGSAILNYIRQEVKV